MKKLYALILSAALLLSGCAASEGESVSEPVSGSVSDGITSGAAESAPSDISADISDNTGSDASDTSSEPASPPDNPSVDKPADAPDTAPAVTENASEPADSGSAASVPPAADSGSDASVPPAPDSGSDTSVPPSEITVSSTAATTPEKVPEPAPASEDGFYVSGTKLYDANGSEFVMRGINHPHNWFKNQDETALTAIAATGANCVRIVCSDGQQYSRDGADALTALVNRCKELKMVAILEVHDITGKDDPAGLEKTVDYWIDVKDALIGSEAYVILNIANEWVGTWESDTWARGYTAAIPRLREAGIRNTVMVDSAGWGQYAQSVSDRGGEVFAADPLGNTMFSIHMYGSAGKNDRTIKRNISRVTDKGLCVVIGEFGYTHSDGDVDEEYIMKYCCDNDIGYLGWSWKGNGGGVEYLDIALEWDGSVLSEDWGKNLIEGDTGIRKTSKICSIYS